RGRLVPAAVAELDNRRVRCGRALSRHAGPAPELAHHPGGDRVPELPPRVVVLVVSADRDQDLRAIADRVSALRDGAADLATRPTVQLAHRTAHRSHPLDRYLYLHAGLSSQSSSSHRFRSSGFTTAWTWSTRPRWTIRMFCPSTSGR